MGDLISEKFQTLKETTDHSSLSHKQSDLLTSLLLAEKSETNDKNHLSENELYGNLFIFILAGHETTSTTLTFSLLLLAIYPEIQEKLYKEVNKAIDQRLPTFDDYANLRYAQYIMKETLRLYPPAATVLKYATKDITLQVPAAKYQNLNTNTSPENPSTQNEYTPLLIPQGTRISINIAAVHRNPLYWENPEEFIPERFDPINTPFKKEKKESNTEDEEEKIDNNLPYHRQAWIPFSDGIRSCIGRKFSEVEYAFVLTLISQRYTWRLSPKWTKEQALATHQGAGLVRPKHQNIELILTKRENAPTDNLD